MAFEKSGSETKCFLTGAPVRSLNKFYLGVILLKTSYPEKTLAYAFSIDAAHN